MGDIKANDLLTSKDDNITQAYVVGIASDKLGHQVYVEIKWAFEDTTQCYVFPINIWERQQTFLHNNYYNVQPI